VEVTGRPSLCMSRPVSQVASMGRAEMLGNCLNPSKLRGNHKPFDTLFSMMGSTPILSMTPLLSRMPAFRNREVPEVFVKMEYAAAPLYLLGRGEGGEGRRPPHHRSRPNAPASTLSPPPLLHERRNSNTALINQ
jgi:hypothetical protein